MPRLLFSAQEDERSLPQFRLWEDGSWYRAYVESGKVIREYEGAIFNA
jgi:hypothetical protein